MELTADDQPALKPSRFSTLGQASLRAARQLQKTELDFNTLSSLAGASAILLLLTQTLQTERPSVRVAGVTAALFLLAAGVATLAARYRAGLSRADSAPYPGERRAGPGRACAGLGAAAGRRISEAGMGAPIEPGLHAHLPWPVDRVILVPVQRIQAVQVGHEGDEKERPEDVLWAVEHAPNEYTLLLGNGRDLITIDAAVQYRIVNAPAWAYSTQNPAAALKAIAYRAVMRLTVDLTLSDALSQNIATLTGQMRRMAQQEADALGLGVAIVSFTVGGIHPPVPVASAYEEVVSAQLGRVTATVDAQAYRNATVPAAEGAVITGEDAARAEDLQNLALASGQAWSFRTLESQYRAAPTEFFYRRSWRRSKRRFPRVPTPWSTPAFCGPEVRYG